jgi:transcriptional regulator with XRE-family HTH domain
VSDVQNDFTAWLHRQAAAAGYDPDVRGTVSKLAEAAGLDIGSTSRALRGRVAPNPETLRSLAKPLKVTVIEMYLRAGLLRTEDIAEVISPDPDAERGQYVAPSSAELTVGEAARRWRIDAEDQQLLGGVVDELRKRSRRRLEAGE